MPETIFATIALCSLLSFAGCAGEPTVRFAPPPDRDEVAGTPPSSDHFWVRGHWQWSGDRYAWAPGHWEVRREGAVWAPGHWRSDHAGDWVWVEGRWVAR